MKRQCFGKRCFYICIASIQSMVLSSLSLVYLFLSLRVYFGMLVSSQSERTHGKLKDVVSPCVIEVTLSVDFQVGTCHVIVVLIKTAFFFFMNGFHMIFIVKNSQIHPDVVEDDSKVMLIC